MITKFNTYNESVRGMMKPKTEKELDMGWDIAVEKMVKLIMGYYNVTKREAENFIIQHIETFEWALMNDGKSVEQLYREWEHILYNEFGERKIR